MQKVQESINASNFLLVGNQTGTTKNKTEEAGLGFADVFADVNSKDVTEQKSDVSQVADRKESVDYSKENATDTVKKEAVVSKKETVEKEVSKTLDVPDMDLSEEEEEIVLETIGTVLKMIMEQFGLSAKELEEKLQAFGMEIEELLSTDGLKEFFLNMKDADVSDLIVNEDLNQELQNFLNQFDDLLSGNDVTPEKISEVLKEFDFDLEELLTDISTETDLNIKTDKDVVENNQIEGAVSETEEPEVIIETRTKQNNSSNEQQTETKAKSKEVKTSEFKTETTSVKKEGFENPILQAIHEAFNQVEDVKMSEQPIYGRDVIEQIVDQIRINMNQDTTSMEMQLYPEHLGKIQINVVSKDGVMTAKIVAETEAAKQAIENGLTNLKESMQQQNLKVDAIEVMVATTGFEKGSEEQQAFEDKNTSKSGRKHLDLSELEEEEEPDAEIERMKAIGSSVSFSA